MFGGDNGYGYTLDPDGHMVTSFTKYRARRLGSNPVPSQVDWTQHLISTAFDQGPTSSCFGAGEAGSLYGAFSLAGKQLNFIPSQKLIYDVGRLVDRVPDELGNNPPLTDSGVMANQGIRGLAEWGIGPMGPQALDGRFSDVNPPRRPGDDDMGYVACNDEPFLIDLEKADECKIEGPYRIDSMLKTQVVEDLVVSLSNRILVACGIFVDRRTEDWTPAKGPLGRPDFSDPEGGWHWIFFYGYHTLGNGKRVFLWRNSWGNWGRDGNGEGDEDFAAASVDRYAKIVRRVA